MTSLITVPEIGATPQIAINPEGEKLKLQLLNSSRSHTSITDDVKRDMAIVSAGCIKAHLSQVEKERVAIKEPFLTAGRAIDAAAKSHVTELEVELKRLNNLNGAYEAEKQRIARIEEQRRAAEEARLAREKLAAEREALRLQEEAEKKAAALALKGKEPTDAQKAKAMEDQMEAAEKLEKYEAEQARLMRERNEEQVRLLETKPTGGSLRQEIDITILDLRALYAHNHGFVRMEADLNSIKFFIRTELEKGNTPVIPGISFSQRSVFSARGAR